MAVEKGVTKDRRCCEGVPTDVDSRSASENPHEMAKMCTALDYTVNLDYSNGYATLIGQVECCKLPLSKIDRCGIYQTLHHSSEEKEVVCSEDESDSWNNDGHFECHPCTEVVHCHSTLTDTIHRSVLRQHAWRGQRQSLDAERTSRSRREACGAKSLSSSNQQSTCSGREWAVTALGLLRRDHGRRSWRPFLAVLLSLWLLLLQAEAQRVDHPVTKQRIARREGDIVIGALFPMHYAPSLKTAFTRRCGTIREYYGVQRIETFQHAIREINADPDLLPNITLGWDIRDSCWFSAIALEQSIDFIKDAIASLTGLARNGSSAGECAPEHRKPIAGLIGPGSSESTIQVQNLLQIFQIPQMGYSATSMDLSDKNRFRYFLRVVPPDNYQAQALIDIVVRYNWTYISTVKSDGNYGERGMEEFADLARKYNICIATTDNIESTADEEEFDRVVTHLLTTSNASTVVCFCEGMTIRNLLRAAKRRDVHGNFLFIGSDGWGNRKDVVEGLEDAAVGGISIKLYSPPLPHFQRHYAALRPPSSDNPWLEEFWQEKFQCYLDGPDRDRRYSEPCPDNLTLANSEQDSKLGFVHNAVYSMAHALHNMQRALCGGTSGLCRHLAPINGSMYLNFLLNVSLTSYSGESVHFDENGDPPGRYEILNFQKVEEDNGSMTYQYVNIGSWMTGTLTMQDDVIQWPAKCNRQPCTSVCSEPCPRGHIKKVRGVSCCWVCTPCKENEIVVDNETCSPCQLGYWPDEDQANCTKIPVEFTSWHDTEAIVSMVIACLGFVFAMWIASVFVRHNDTPVVKASTRELSYIILLGTVMAFASNLAVVAPPSMTSCYLTRILPGLAFSLMYGALVTKTNRIARILEGSKRIMTKKPRFMSAWAQVVITGIIIGVECAIITVMLILEPADSELGYPAPRRVRRVCNTSTLGTVAPLAFDLALIFMCTLYAVKTRNLPENFNEAKFIGFTMYTTCVIWLGFFPIYFGGGSKVVTMCVSMSLSAIIALALLFVPKVYIIIWCPEKNTRGAFTTSKDVRCHIGSKSFDSFERDASRYDGVGTGAGKPAWQQKSLDEKKLRFVMKRSAMASSSSTTPLVLPSSSSTSSTSLAPPSSSAKMQDLATQRAAIRRRDHHPSLYSRISQQRLVEDLAEVTSEGLLVRSLMADPEMSLVVEQSGGVLVPRLMCDSESQTDDDLLQRLALGVRQRHRPLGPSPRGYAGIGVPSYPLLEMEGTGAYHGGSGGPICGSSHATDSGLLQSSSLRSSAHTLCAGSRAHEEATPDQWLLDDEDACFSMKHESLYHQGERGSVGKRGQWSGGRRESEDSQGGWRGSQGGGVEGARRASSGSSLQDDMVFLEQAVNPGHALFHRNNPVYNPPRRTPVSSRPAHPGVSESSNGRCHSSSESSPPSLSVSNPQGSPCRKASGADLTSPEGEYPLPFTDFMPTRSSVSDMSLTSDPGSRGIGESEADELSPVALHREERDVLDFQRYLAERGMRLDLSSVQTSDL